jgi:predicted transcriptional regulator
MALNDDEQKKIEAELAQTKAQLTELLEKSKTESNKAKEAEEKRQKGESGGGKLDPDVVKEIEALKQKVAALEGERKALGGAGGFRMPNFFGED